MCILCLRLARPASPGWLRGPAEAAAAGLSAIGPPGAERLEVFGFTPSKRIEDKEV
jgi:hypothetical protein